ncbi:HAMP domain-containing sensor histidine kinase [Streptomyces sp. ISL-94]|uniref:HAMP domain-containing sensor histidine kinase n=1 Tax=Streptomyces sp. ISL-94 TaxID=2819190 RepID=UPI001BE9D6ED|nr:HAMP domain-containing sensor histidine kinase [Streptomyces sp. ISL-94]MBT2481117.1 HAMP domain-containing histidine kinase [Streptomyces sp. ISL-94]
MKWAPPRRLGTVRARFTALYAGLFLLSGTALLLIAAAVASGSRASRAVPGTAPEQPGTPARAQARIEELEQQLARVQESQSAQILLGSAVALAVMAVVSLVLGWFVAGRVLRPLRTVTEATRRISADNLHERLAVPGPGDEVKDLADTIDGLLERLEGSFAAQRRFVANASHELRTPLATMRAAVDVAVAKPGPVPEQTLALAGRMRGELDQVDRLLEGFLVLARSRHGDFTDAARVPLEEVVSASLGARAPDIAAKELTVRRTDADGRAQVWASRSLLRRLVDNLVDNAITHNDTGGRIGVSTRAGGDTVRLAVETGGPVLDPGQVAELAQPFRRLGADRTGRGRGSGLGLSIVAAVAEAHGGTLELRARPEGGLRVTVTLPGADRADGAAA